MFSIYETKFIFVYCLALTAILGAALGSFLNCAAYRAVRGGSVLRGRSRCSACGRALGPAELVPVLGWLFLRGRCRRCGEKISARYPLTEALFAVLSVICLLRFDLTAEFLRNWVLLGCLFCLTLTDLEDHVIPDACHVVAVLAWLAALPFLGWGWRTISQRLLAALTYGCGVLLFSLAMDRLLGRDTMGGGDIKLIAVMGLYLGLVRGLFALLLSCVLGLLGALLLRRDGRREFPFGPAIAAATVLMLFWGGGLAAWYIGLF